MMSGLVYRLVACFTLSLLAGCSESIVDPPAAPPRPAGLRAELVSPHSVRLSWDAVVMAGETISYGVYRNQQKIGDAAGTDFVDTALVSNTLHVWYVVARTSKGALSAPSEPAAIATTDIEPPSVVAATPANSASAVSRLPSPSVTFSEAMIPASIDAAAMVVTLTTTGERVYGSVRYDAASRSADFWPFAILPAGASVSVTVTTAAKDVAGNSLTAPYSFTFTTGDDPAGTSQLPPASQPLLFSHRSGVGNVYDVFKSSVDGGGHNTLTPDEKGRLAINFKGYDISPDMVRLSSCTD